MRRLTLLAPALALLVLGCSEPRAVPIIGPDGSHMFHVSCGHREGECYRLAGERCPYGYDVGRTIAGAGNMLVRCRVPMTGPSYPSAQYRPPAAVPTATYAVPAQPSPPPLPPAAPAAELPPPAASASSVPPASSAAWPSRATALPTRRVLPARHGKVDLGY